MPLTSSTTISETSGERVSIAGDLQATVGTLTSAVDIVSMALGHNQGVGGIVSGAYSGSVDFYISCDNGVTFQRTIVLFTPAGSSGTPRVVDSVGSSTTGYFQFLCLAGATHVGLQIPTWSSGTVNVSMFGTSQIPGELTWVGVDAINGPQSPRFGVVGGVDSAGFSRVLRIPASKILFRDVGALVTIKASPGVLFGLHVENNQATAAWLQIFDASAPTLGTTNPDLELLLPANSSKDFSLSTQGLQFATQIRMAGTTTEKGAATSAAGTLVWAFFA